MKSYYLPQDISQELQSNLVPSVYNFDKGQIAEISRLTFARAGESNISYNNIYVGPFASGEKAIVII